MGFYKKSSGKPGLTYTESVDEALCFGWIDGIVKKTGPDSFMHRFTPRRPDSIWSNVNVRHVAPLTTAGKMHPSGVRAFDARLPGKSGIYTYEQATRPACPQTFPAPFEKIFRANRPAWRFWGAQPSGYQRTAIGWVISAKQTAMQQRRLALLIADSAAGRDFPPELTSPERPPEFAPVAQVVIVLENQLLSPSFVY